MSEPIEKNLGGAPDDPLIGGLEDAAGYLSRVAGSVRVIAGHQPSKAIRQELRRILAALEGAKLSLNEAREAHHKRKQR